MTRQSRIVALVGLVLFLVGATPAVAAFPGVRGMIAFQEGGSIATIPRNVVDLRLHAIADGSSPAWSADGTQIAYVANGDVWVMNADGSNKVRVTRAGGVQNAAWSPDGTRIAYATQYQGGEDSVRLNVVTLGGGSDVPITTNGRYCGAPSWSPTGDIIAYSCHELYTPARSGIWTVQPDGGAERQLTFPGPYERDSCPDWKPDGSQLIFLHEGSSGTGIRRMRPDGGDLQPIGPPTTSCAQWSPEGTGLVLSDEPSKKIVSVALESGFDAGTEYLSLGADPPQLPTWQPVGPTPQISGVEGAPVAGALGATIAVDGRGFVPRSVVRWNGVARPTTFVGPTRLTAQLSAADLADPGSGQVTVYTSPTGGGLSAAHALTIAPPPPPPPTPAGPRALITAATFTASWHQSRVRGQLRVTGVVERAGRVEIALLRGSRVSLRALATLPAGPFNRVLRLPAGLLPGGYALRVREITPSPGIAGLSGATRNVVLRAPREGVVARAAISTTGPNGPAVIRHPGTQGLYARFVFAARPARGRPIVTQWLRNGKPVPGSSITRPYSARVDALVKSPARLPSGLWRCVLSAGGSRLAAASVRLG